MVVLEVEIEHVAIAEHKREQPVAVHLDRPSPLACPFQQMQAIARQIQILNLGSGVQSRELQPELARKGWLNPRRGARFEELAKAFACQRSMRALLTGAIKTVPPESPCSGLPRP